MILRRSHLLLAYVHKASTICIHFETRNCILLETFHSSLCEMQSCLCPTSMCLCQRRDAFEVISDLQLLTLALPLSCIYLTRDLSSKFEKLAWLKIPKGKHTGKSFDLQQLYQYNYWNLDGVISNLSSLLCVQLFGRRRDGASPGWRLIQKNR